MATWGDKADYYYENNDRRRKFLHAAKDAFKKKHGMSDSDKSSDAWMLLSKQENLPNGDSAETLTSFYPWWDEEPYEFGMNAEYNIYDKDDTKNRDRVCSDKYGDYAKEGNHTQRDYAKYGPLSNYGKNSAPFTDVDNFIHGKSKYIQGKGWNESFTRRVADNIIKCINKDVSRIGNYIKRIFEDNLRAYIGWMVDNEEFTQNGIRINVHGQVFHGTVEVTLNPLTDLFDVSFIQNGLVVDKLQNINVCVLMMEMDKKINGGYLRWERR